MLGMQELIVILLIVVLIFGAKRIPEIMSGLGKGIRSFKKTMEEDDTQITSTTPPPQLDTTTAKGESGTAKDKIEPK
jgi:sec-independent protein translocase protein TatA